jgi:hypothetical protein
MTVLQAPARHMGPLHGAAADERCPWCDQTIPHEKFSEIRNRIAAKEREQHAAMMARLREDFAREKAQVEARAREEGRRGAELATEAKLAAAEDARKSA